LSPKHCQEHHVLRLAAYAMGTRFEAMLVGGNETELRSAGEAALGEIEQLDSMLDLFVRHSFLSYLNRRAFSKPVPVDPDLFDLFVLCREVSSKSGGAFDVTVGPLMRAWGFRGDAPDDVGNAALVPKDEKEVVGFELLDLDERKLTVRFAKPGMHLDFGAVAKGFALDRACAVLQEAGVEAALIHGGTSTVAAFGSMPDGRGWRVAVRSPAGAGGVLKTVELDGCALSVSAPHGRSFVQDGVTIGHVMDPRTGEPAQGAALTAVVSNKAVLADAWSSAMLVAGLDRFEELADKAGCMAALLCTEDGDGYACEVRGGKPGLYTEPGREEPDLPTGG